MTMRLFKTLFLICLLGLAAAACDDVVEPAPPAPTVPEPPASQFNIVGRWDGQSSQGRPIRFDVSNNVVVIDGELSLHHDCSGGRLVLQLDGYQAQVSGDTFSATLDWRVDEDRRFYTGVLTVSGRFQGDAAADGGWVNSITDKVADNLGVCGPSSGNWRAGKH